MLTQKRNGGKKEDKSSNQELSPTDRFPTQYHLSHINTNISYIKWYVHINTEHRVLCQGSSSLLNNLLTSSWVVYK